MSFLESAEIDVPRTTVFRLDSNFYVNHEELNAIQKCTKLSDKIILAAKWLHTRDIPITTTYLAKLAYGDEEVNSSQEGGISRSINRRFSNEQISKSADFGSDIPAVQLLREHIDAYSGNLYEAKKSYDNIQASSSDWLRNVRIPTSLDEKVYEFLGFVWADAADPKKQQATTSLLLSGRKTDSLLYELMIQPLIKDIFNLSVEYEPQERTSNQVQIGKYASFTTNWHVTPQLKINSLAITSWLTQVGFDKTRDDNPLPILPGDQSRFKSYLSSLLATTAEVKQGKNYLRIKEKRPLFRDHIGFLSTLLGFSPTKPTKSIVLNYSIEQTRELYEKGLLINPHHLIELGYKKKEVYKRS